VFKGNTFAHVDPYTKNDLALYTCCDTITFGNWGIDSRNDLIYLNSSDYLSTSMVDIQVDEKKVNDTDSLYFLINNPIEKYFKKYGGKKRDVYYKIAIDTQSGLLVKLFQQEYDTNFIKIQKPKGSIIEKFTIYIYPKSNFGGRNIGTREVTTLEYQLKDANTNSFEVNIPLLDYGYMSYIRLN